MPQGSDQAGLANALQTLSAREQIYVLIHATGSLSKRDKAEILRTAGVSLLKERVPPLLLHVFLKRILAGALWGILCIIGALIFILLLAFIEEINRHATTPVIVGAVSFLVGFLLFSLFNFFADILQFLRTTRSRAERNDLLVSLNEREYTEKMALLRTMSLTLARKIPGESLLQSFLLNGCFLAMEALLIILIVLICGPLPAIDSFPWLVLVACLTFLAGFFFFRAVHYRLRFRGIQYS
ncbi:MAG TPA: hypothetical protein VFN35_35025 [Ktedonobacteraceae bacterium]|nr:hypothetical protein [Ktedonobacteraceae bacterium]